jgi:GGDEF domain-containing protein
VRTSRTTTASVGWPSACTGKSLHREVVRPVDIDDDLTLDINMSLGVAVAEPGEDADAVIDRADRAMYRAKNDPGITFAA